MSGQYLLSDVEARRFSEWLRLQIESSKGMVGQFEKLSANISAEMTKREKIKIAAFTVVLNDVESAERITIE